MRGGSQEEEGESGERGWEEVSVRGREGRVGNGRAIKRPKQQHFLFNHRVPYKNRVGTFKTHAIYLPKACPHACILAHAATFAPFRSAHSKSDLYILHDGEAVLNSKLNRSSFTVPLTVGEG